MHFGGPNYDCATQEDLAAWVIKNKYQSLAKETEKDYSSTSNTYYIMFGISFEVLLQLILIDMGQVR